MLLWHVLASLVVQLLLRGGFILLALEVGRSLLLMLVDSLDDLGCLSDWTLRNALLFLLILSLCRDLFLASIIVLLVILV